MKFLQIMKIIFKKEKYKIKSRNINTIYNQKCPHNLYPYTELKFQLEMFFQVLFNVYI